MYSKDLTEDLYKKLLWVDPDTFGVVISPEIRKWAKTNDICVFLYTHAIEYHGCPGIDEGYI